MPGRRPSTLLDRAHGVVDGSEAYWTYTTPWYGTMRWYGEMGADIQSLVGETLAGRALPARKYLLTFSSAVVS